MGLTNTTTTFIQTMNNLFSNMLDSSKEVFLDVILLYSYTVKEHLTLLEKVLVHLHQYMLYCKLKNYSFLSNFTIFISFDIATESMKFE